jgi:hypothetical protein
MGTDGTGVVRDRLDSGVIGRRYPDEDPCIGSCQPFDDLAPVLKRLPGHFEQEALLRIDVGSFARRDAETFRFKLIDPFDESPPPRIGLAWHPRYRVVVMPDAPTILRDFSDRVRPSAQQPPE